MSLTNQQEDFLMSFEQSENTRIKISDIADVISELTRDCIIYMSTSFILKDSITDYETASAYLAEYDASLKISLSMCPEHGIKPDEINSKTLANLLMPDIEIEKWKRVVDEIMSAWEAQEEKGGAE